MEKLREKRVPGRMGGIHYLLGSRTGKSRLSLSPTKPTPPPISRFLWRPGSLGRIHENPPRPAKTAYFQHPHLRGLVGRVFSWISVGTIFPAMGEVLSNVSLNHKRASPSLHWNSCPHHPPFPSSSVPGLAIPLSLNTCIDGPPLAKVRQP